MSISTACKCCSALSRPYRIRLSHSSRLFATSQPSSEGQLKLPKTDWSAFKPKSSSSSGSSAGGFGAGSRDRIRDTGRSNTGGFGLNRGGGGGASGSGSGSGYNRDRGGSAGYDQNAGGGQRRQQGFGASNDFGAGGRGGGYGRDRSDRPRSFGGEQRNTEPAFASNFGLNRGNANRGQTDTRPGPSSSRTPAGRFEPKRDMKSRLDEIRAVTNKAKSTVVPGAAGKAVEVTGEDVESPEIEEGAVEEEEGEFSGRSRGKKPLDRIKSNSRLAIREEEADGYQVLRGKGRRAGEYEQPRFNAQEDEREKRKRQREIELARQRRIAEEERMINIPSSVTVSRLASIFDVKLFRLQTRMNRLGMDANQQRADYILTAEEACDIALEFGFNPIVDDEATFDLYAEPETSGQEYPLRPPVVTIMGHVDHGKTTLLDSLRNTAVAAGEAGGITQHVGAFSVPLKSLLPADAPPTDATITFLDTPGHAAFTAMRARGASVTDIVVLVVAADDGVMPQTQEVLDLVKSEGDKVGLVIAINKIDKPGVDVDKVKSALGAAEVHLEEDGGDIQSVRVSGLSRIGLDNLVETLSTLAELRDLRARTDGKAEGVVLESNVNRGAGRVATVLVTRGTLKTGSVVVAGHTWCKVRNMTDDKGKSLSSAGPGTPVVVTGWKEIPHAGDEILEAPNGEGEARKAIGNRLKEAERKKMLADAEVINQKRREERDKATAEDEEAKLIKAAGGNLFEARLQMAKKAADEARRTAFKELRLVIKGDVSGTVEAVEGALMGIGNKEAGVKIISTGVGEISSADISLAEASEAIVIGFNVPCPASIKRLAAQKKVECHLESVIYRLIETVRAKTAALLPPKIESRVLGEANVQAIFHINLGRKKTVAIAGCKCINGEINKKDRVRVLRGAGRQKIFEGKIDTLKHLKKEVDEIRKGMECGIQIEGFEDLKEGDEIVTYSTFEVPREL